MEHNWVVYHPPISHHPYLTYVNIFPDFLFFLFLQEKLKIQLMSSLITNLNPIFLSPTLEDIHDHIFGVYSFIPFFSLDNSWWKIKLFSSHISVRLLTDQCAFKIEYWYNDCCLTFIKIRSYRYSPKERMGETTYFGNT